MDNPQQYKLYRREIVKHVVLACSLAALAACGGGGAAPLSGTAAPPAPPPPAPSPPAPPPPPPPVQSGHGIGVFALSPVGSPAPDAFLTNEALAGIVVRQQWSDIATTANAAQNNYSFIRGELDRAAAAKKQVSLIVSWAGKATPAWAIANGVPTYSYINPNEFQPDFGATITVPASWDARYATEVGRFVATLGAAISTHPALQIVNTHCVSASSPDWFLPINSPENIQLLKDRGYTNDAQFAACRAIVDATMRAFPNQAITMAFGQLPQSLTGQREGDFLARQIVDYVRQNWPDRRFYAMRWNLNTVVPDPRSASSITGGWGLVSEQQTNLTDQIFTAAQWVWPASDTSTCRANGNRSPCDALTNLAAPGDIAVNGYGMRYLEVYGADVSNSSLSGALTTIADAIRAHFGG